MTLGDSMKKISCYRIDHRELNVGDVILSSGDHIAQLNSELNVAELALRNVSRERAVIRATGLYAFENSKRAEKYFLGKKGYLYEIEVDEQDVLHTANLLLVNKIAEARSKDAKDSLIKSYWDGERGDGDWIEILAKKATVKKLMYTAKDKIALKNKLYP
jgi:hypothetical protein